MSPRRKDRPVLVTRADVARLAGVSGSVVSAVINEGSGNNTRVSEATRRRVLEVIRSTGYRPQHTARALRRGKTGLVASLGLRMRGMPIHGPNETAMFRLAEHLNAAGLRLTVDYAERDTDAFRMPTWDVDGAVINYAYDPDDLDEVERAGIPYVSLNGHCGPNGAAVLVDDRQGMTLLMDHLLGLGHRRVAMVNRPAASHAGSAHSSTKDRRSTFDRLMAERGLRPVHAEFAPVAHGTAPDPAALRSLLERERVTAVVAFHHFLGAEVLHMAHALGVNVPGDLSVACFNNEYPSAVVYPALTVVALPVDEMGRVGAELLVEQVREERRRPRRVMLPERLVVRSSTAAAPGK